MVSTGDQLSIEPADLVVRRVGEPAIPSPMARLLNGRASSQHYVHQSDRVLLDDTVETAVARKCGVGELPSAGRAEAAARIRTRRFLLPGSWCIGAPSRWKPRPLASAPGLIVPAAVTPGAKG